MNLGPARRQQAAGSAAASTASSGGAVSRIREPTGAGIPLDTAQRAVRVRVAGEQAIVGGPRAVTPRGDGPAIRWGHQL
ncbi:MAG TPA: hypothetical protein VGS62_04180 [Streptosporangiaceae bacterium]|nr:hypothetical protein [Streptosporangiaceae bacterium]